ncbi:MAG: hypothetical protein M1828_002864 [Chrysothrix sp. TS-e1954]|nr:MAG: hypothetical protein M1828_002864 [Chrysothrix sp. TS-e1954]
MDAYLEGWIPLTRNRWELVVWAWQFFPILTAVQWLTDFYPQGKTSIESRFNLPGKYAWAIMESPGFLIVLYLMLTLPQQTGLDELPWGNWTMAGIYTIHYLYRAWLSPLVLNPSMSPIHALVFASAFLWQVINGISIGGWLAGYGPTSAWDWTGRVVWINAGLVVWGWSWLGNMFHDDELREIRRDAMRRQQESRKSNDSSSKAVSRNSDSERVGAEKIYMMPQNGLFSWILYPHYLCEFLEWTGFWMIGGWSCIPARSFLFNEIATMVPRALAGRRWYIQTFGKDEVGSRKAIVPGIL